VAGQARRRGQPIRHRSGSSSPARFRQGLAATANFRTRAGKRRHRRIDLLGKAITSNDVISAPLTRLASNLPERHHAGLRPAALPPLNYRITRRSSVVAVLANLSIRIGWLLMLAIVVTVMVSVLLVSIVVSGVG
jgi:hypothetical protein